MLYVVCIIIGVIVTKIQYVRAYSYFKTSFSNFIQQQPAICHDKFIFNVVYFEPATLVYVNIRVNTRENDCKYYSNL